MVALAVGELELVSSVIKSVNNLLLLLLLLLFVFIMAIYSSSL